MSSRSPYDPDKPRRARRKKGAPEPPAEEFAQPETVPAEPRQGYEKYQAHPEGYVRDVLGIQTVTAVQSQILRAIHRPPYKVLVRCGHGVGKSELGSWLICYHFDCFPEESVTLSSAPTYRDVNDILWRRVRMLRYQAGLPGMVGAATPELRDGADRPMHYAKGFAAEKGESFSGRHQEHMGFLFDEASGIIPIFWETVPTMFQARLWHWWVCFFNPLDTGCEAYKQERRGGWHVVEMSCLDHPNIAAELRGLPPVIPGAIRLSQVQALMHEFCDPVTDAAEREVNDFTWPPEGFRAPGQAGEWWRPQPQFESRIQGRWPSGDVFGVWSRRTWQQCLHPFQGYPPLALRPEFGVDVAYHGDDYTCLHGRWGPLSFLHERHNGWSPRQTAERLKLLCAEAAARYNARRDEVLPQARDAPRLEPEEILVKVDGDGLGVNVLDNRGGFNFVAVCGSGSPIRKDRYANKRAEVWFDVAALAREGMVCLERVGHEVKQRLEEQLLSVKWSPAQLTGLCLLEPKEETKKRLRCSPDDADAFLLAYCTGGTVAAVAWQHAAMQAAANRDPFGQELRKPWEAPTTVDRPGGLYREAQDDDRTHSGNWWHFGQ